MHANTPKHPIFAPQAPAALGPYSHAYRAGDFVICSGQTPIDPATGKLVEGDITAQTEQVLKNIAAVLNSAGLALADVVKTTVFMTDLSEFAVYNAVYASFFPTDPPARSTVQVAALPLGARIEIEAMAVAVKS